MTDALTWDEAKRAANIAKHGLDFADSAWVLESEIRLDVAVTRGSEVRVQSFAYVFEMLAVLTLVHVAGESAVRVISFRCASTKERVAYHEWLENDDA